ncbi:type VII secretion target [Gordonia sp. (in: high G+C Gram-positive bacteria)]|uniref:type VII secretion target n=1 Tax=Gordonia sp. (in: high G+C Gram-positive bacteria) TaxID=84139 RepID=UPI003C7134B9
MNAKTNSPVAAGSPTVVDPAATTTVATTQGSAASTVAARALAERLDTGRLAPTFGLIGASFLAALSRVQSARTRTLDGLAAQHGRTGESAVRAQASYDCCEATNASHLREVSA